MSERRKGLFFRTVGEIASENIAIVDVNDSIRSVAQTMCGKQRSSCAVVMKEGEIIGLVTDRDMTKSVVAQDMDTNQPIADVMTPNPVLIEDDAKVSSSHFLDAAIQHSLFARGTWQASERTSNDNTFSA